MIPQNNINKTNFQTTNYLKSEWCLQISINELNYIKKNSRLQFLVIIMTNSNMNSAGF